MTVDEAVAAAIVARAEKLVTKPSAPRDSLRDRIEVTIIFGVIGAILAGSWILAGVGLWTVAQWLHR